MPKDQRADGDEDGEEEAREGRRGGYERLATIRASSPLRCLGGLAVSAEDVLGHLSTHLYQTQNRQTVSNPESKKQVEERRRRENVLDGASW